MRSPLPTRPSRPSTKKSDGTEMLVTTGSVDGCSKLPETEFVGTRLHVDTTQVSSVGGSLPPCGAAGERSEFNIKPPLGATLLICPRGHLQKYFPQGDTSARQRCLKTIFLLLGEQRKAIEPHLLSRKIHQWQLGPTKWSSHMTNLLDAIAATTLRLDFPGESLRPATGGSACNFPVLEAWTKQASGCCLCKLHHTHQQKRLTNQTDSPIKMPHTKNVTKVANVPHPAD